MERPIQSEIDEMAGYILPRRYRCAPPAYYLFTSARDACNILNRTMFQLMNTSMTLDQEDIPMKRATAMLGIVCMAVTAAVIAHTVSAAEPKARRARARDLGIEVGVMEPGTLNAITDVPGVLVGHRTLVRGADIRTGVTAILPHGGNIFLEKVPAAIAVGNGFGKLAGSTQVGELGNIETPIVLTNTLSVGTAVEAVVRYTLTLSGNEDIRSVNAVVGETNDGYLNDIRGMHVSGEDVLAAIRDARDGLPVEGSAGAGTGTVCFRFKGGIGTASRIVPIGKSGSPSGSAAVSVEKHYTIGVLVQTNFGGLLDVNGAPVGRELKSMREKKGGHGGDGSCMIVIATDAPLAPRNLKRLARRAFLGLARTGSYMSNGTGDYAIAFSTAYRIAYGVRHVDVPPLVANDAMTPIFRAVVEATREAVYNSLFMATTVEGHGGHTVEAIPIADVLEICRKYNVLNMRDRFAE